ncbi:MAG: pentapeptide repeat-containing protein, partial [Methanomicrobia archaeon]|nr:pentapeptide repeat-containing protein [Methanomicrobia archaeon]
MDLSRKPIYFILIFVLLLSFCYFPVVVGEDETCIHEGCNEPIWDGSNEYCIFHDPDPNKDKVLFEQKLKEKIERGDTDSYDFSGFVFPADIDFFKGHKFKYAIFDGATFKGNANFSNAHFYGNIDFSGAIFENAASFNDATFHSLADFNGTQFLNSAPKFNNAIFEKEARFTYTYFQKGGRFIQTTFENYVFFDGDPDSQEATFGDEAAFDKAKFVGEGKVEFRHVIFEGKANFNNTTFSKETRFTYGKFYNTVDFQHSTFEKDLNFTGMIFGVEDNGVQHTEINVTFHEAKFYGETKFFDCVFNVNATFYSAKFEQIFTFAPTKNGEIDLRYFRCFGDGKIIADLDQTRFQGIYSIENLV